MFLWNANLTIFKLVLLWVGVCAALYGCITVMPIFCRGSPYYTPLSFLVWHITHHASSLEYHFTFPALRRLALFDDVSGVTYRRFRDIAGRYGKWLLRGMQKTVEEAALNSSSDNDIDTCASCVFVDVGVFGRRSRIGALLFRLTRFLHLKVVEDPFPNLTEVKQSHHTHEGRRPSTRVLEYSARNFDIQCTRYVAWITT